MVRPGRDRLCGRIEVDEAYVGRSNVGGKQGGGSEGKEIVVIAAEVHSPKGFGRVRMRHIPDVSASSLVPFVCDVAEKGSEIVTDGCGGYNQLSKRGYEHTKAVLANTGDPAHVRMPGVHGIAALVKRWLLSTQQGSVSGNIMVLPPVQPTVTEHIIYEYFCSPCGTKVESPMTEALPKATLRLRLTLLWAYLHYALGMTARNICAWLRTFCRFHVTPGGLVLNCLRLAELLTPV